MGNYEQLKQSVSDVIKTNGNQEITGSILQNVLLTIISSVGANATFAGVATPTTNPGTPDGPVFYLASESGTYTNFGGIELQDGLSILMWNGSWSSQQIFAIDDEPTAGSNNLVKSGGVYAKIKAIEDAGYVFAGVATPTTNPGTPDGPVFYLASESGTYTNFNAIELQDGLSILMWNGSWSSQQIFGIDNVPTAGSDNLVKSGGVEKKTGNIITKDGYFSIVDKNGYVGVLIDNEGLKTKNVYVIERGSFLSVADVIKFVIESFKSSQSFYICDTNGYILFGVLQDGTIIGKLSGLNPSDICKSLVFKGVTYNTSENKIIIPDSAVQINYAAKLELPKKINLLQDSVYNLYFEQMLGYGFLRDYKVSEVNLPYFQQFDCFVHNSNTIGDSTKTISLWNGFGYKMEEKSLIIHTIDKATAGSLKVCVIGDSMTENAKKLFELANLAANDSNFTITFLGARTATGTDSAGITRTVKHCGYSGRNIVHFCQSATLNNYSNPFYDANIEGTNKFSIAKGIENMGDIPDIVIIDHGANQTVNEWSTVKGCYDFIINDITTYNTANNTNIKVVICVQQPGGLIFTINPSSRGSKWGRDYSPTKLMYYINEYDDRENEGIFLLPQYLIIDPHKDYPRTDAPYSNRNSSLREIALDNVHMGINMDMHDNNHVYSYGEICTDGNDNGYISLKNNNTAPLSDDKIHWAKTKDDVNAGYWKLADAYFAELKYIASL